ncbi:SLAM family member 5 isoform X2 [Pempheris klunzingeri]|uniref:SLAM family member 5 isoform X2 n=1 Tax=Pempheris klunzingeri TaxID=3127111 RepID=UPI0039812222
MMGGGRLRCLSCFFTCSAVLLLGVCPHDVEASSCQRVIHKKVGDTVELSSCLPTEWVSLARWKYRELIITKDSVVLEKNQFKDRLFLNTTNFSLTVRRLTLQDSGDFSFLSEVNETQRGTVTITLHVHEPITKQPVLTSNSTWNASTKSCMVFLDCSATSDSSVTYSWTVGNQTISGSRLRHIIGGQDEETRFTCTIHNFVSNQSASETVKCSNTTHESSVDFIFILSVAGGSCLMIAILVGIAISVCHHKQNQAGSDSNDLTVYADISEVATEAGNSFCTSPRSVYETANRVGPVIPGPQTVYDKIQLSRVRKPSVSPYQEVS